MNDKKLKGKQKWCLNAVATLKPFIERKEHITRSTAVRLVKPNTNWQRRELDTLRKQANQIIRGEVISPLTYTVFGMALENPVLHEARELFKGMDSAENENITRELNGMVRAAGGDDLDWAALYMPEPTTHQSDLVWPPKEPLRIMGVQRTPYDVFNQAGGRRHVTPGDAWFIRNEHLSSMEMVYVENEHTYVLFDVTTDKRLTSAARYIYPECVFVAAITVKEVQVSEVAAVKTECPENPAIYRGTVKTDNFSLTEFHHKANEEIERDLVQRIVNGTFGQKVSLGTTAEEMVTPAPEPVGLPSNIVLAEPDMSRYLTSMHSTTHGAIAVASDTVYIFDKQYGWCLREAYEEQPTPIKRSFMQRLLGWLCK